MLCLFSERPTVGIAKRPIQRITENLFRRNIKSINLKSRLIVRGKPLRDSDESNLLVTNIHFEAHI